MTPNPKTRPRFAPWGENYDLSGAANSLPPGFDRNLTPLPSPDYVRRTFSNTVSENKKALRDYVNSATSGLTSPVNLTPPSEFDIARRSYLAYSLGMSAGAAGQRWSVGQRKAAPSFGLSLAPAAPAIKRFVRPPAVEIGGGWLGKVFGALALFLTPTSMGGGDTLEQQFTMDTMLQRGSGEWGVFYHYTNDAFAVAIQLEGLRYKSFFTDRGDYTGWEAMQELGLVSVPTKVVPIVIGPSDYIIGPMPAYPAKSEYGQILPRTLGGWEWRNLNWIPQNQIGIPYNPRH